MFSAIFVSKTCSSIIPTRAQPYQASTLHNSHLRRDDVEVGADIKVQLWEEEDNGEMFDLKGRASLQFGLLIGIKCENRPGSRGLH